MSRDASAADSWVLLCFPSRSSSLDRTTPRRTSRQRPKTSWICTAASRGQSSSSGTPETVTATLTSERGIDQPNLIVLSHYRSNTTEEHCLWGVLSFKIASEERKSCRFRTSKWWQNDGFWVDDPCKGQYFPLLLIFRVRNMKLLTSTESGCVHFNPDSSEIHFSKSFLSTLKTLTAWNLIIARDQT